MRLAVIGGGTVGAVTAAGFSALGHEVVCIENRPERLAQLRRGRFAPYEPGLEALAAAGVERGALRFSNDMAEALRFANLLFICVGTPEAPNGAADLSQLDSVAADISRAIGGISGGNDSGGYPLTGGGDFSSVPMGGSASVISDSGGIPVADNGNSGSVPATDSGALGGGDSGGFPAGGGSSVGQYPPGRYLMVIKSAVPPGAHRRLAALLHPTAARRPDNDGGKAGDSPAAAFEVACVPEFLREGNAVADFFHPDRIVIGVDSPAGRAVLEELYRPFDCPKIRTGPATAELVKYAANAFLAMKISYANLLSDLSEAAGADLGPLLDGVGADPRIGRAYLEAGMGYGGRCLPKDLRALTHYAAANPIANPATASLVDATANPNPAAVVADADTTAATANAAAAIADADTAANANPAAVVADADTTAANPAAIADADTADANPAAALLAAVEGLNQARPARIVGRAAQALGGLEGRWIAVWGLAFKPRTDDVRNAPSLAVVRRLLEAGAQVGVHDPAAVSRFAAAFGPHPALHCYADMYEAAQGCDALLLLTEWADYRRACLARLRRVMARPLVVDGRRLFDPAAMAASGFRYEALGQPPGLTGL